MAQQKKIRFLPQPFWSLLEPQFIKPALLTKQNKIYNKLHSLQMFSHSKAFKKKKEEKQIYFCLFWIHVVF